MPVSSHQPIHIGDFIDACYLIERKLGEGGMTAVYLAQDWQDNKNQVVIKIISEEFAAHPKAAIALQHEAEILGQLNHPAIVQLLKHDASKIILEYVGGVTLKQALQQAEIYFATQQSRTTILRQLKAALNYLHGQGIVHGDVKPGNIILQTNSKIKLIDFSLARFYKKENNFDPTELLAYTPAYASKNVQAGKPVMPDDDWHAFGIISQQISD